MAKIKMRSSKETRRWAKALLSEFSYIEKNYYITIDFDNEKTAEASVLIKDAVEKFGAYEIDES